MLIVSTVLLALLFVSCLFIAETNADLRAGKYFLLVTSGIPLAYLITQLFR
jgi:hypothetical protein